MREMILKITGNTDDIEVLQNENGKENFCGIDIDSLIGVLMEYRRNSGVVKKEKVTICRDEYIAIGERRIVIKQSEHKRIVTYSNKSYEINFPNSIYIIEHNVSKINRIHAYCYKKYDGIDTDLFRYAMPNMLSGNSICMGTAPKQIENSDYLLALENIIYTQYTHSNVNDVKSFKGTKKYFEYLEKNEYPYDLMISLNQKLKDII